MCPGEVVPLRLSLNRAMIEWRVGKSLMEIEKDDLSLLEEELIQLTVRNTLVVIDKKPTLVCKVWIKKTCNPNSFRAQVKSIWKTQKKLKLKQLAKIYC